MPVYRFFRRIAVGSKSFLLNLNLFESDPPSEDPNTIRDERLLTRIFLVLLFLSTCIMFFYMMIDPITLTRTIQRPTYIKYQTLFDKYGPRLICPCQRLSTTYDQFIRIYYIQHQVCQSVFITDEWIVYLKSSTIENIGYYTGDFRVLGIHVFQALRTICQATSRSIDNNLLRFYASQYVSATVTPLDIMNIQIRTYFEQFKSSTISSFLLSWDLTQDSIQVNGFLSITMSNFLFYFSTSSNDATFAPSIYGNCRCRSSVQCVGNMTLRDFNTNWNPIISSFYRGCLTTESLLQSNLACLYDQQCISAIQSYMNKSLNTSFIALNQSFSSRFNTTFTMRQIVNELMVESWTMSSSHEDYYNRCQPEFCTYTEQGRNDVIYLISALLGLVGGLITILQLSLPHFMLIYRKIQTFRNNPLAYLNRPIHQIFYRLWTWNIFSSVPPSTNPSEIRIQRISTRLYLIGLTLLIGVVFVYMSSRSTSILVVIKSPAIDQYSALYNIYLDSLSCPCSQISINYQDILTVNFDIHQICTSIYVTPEWIAYMSALTNITFLYNEDFRSTASYVFQGLRAFCKSSNETTVYGLRNLLTSRYISSYLVSRNTFELQMQSIFDYSLSRMSSQFLSNLQTVRDIFQANNIFRATGNQYILRLFNNNNNEIHTGVYPYPSCLCSMTPKCVRQSNIYNRSGSILYSVPGMYFGCSTTEALLQSSLECFFRRNCIDEFLAHFPVNNLTDSAAILNISTLKRSEVNSTVQELVNRLMVEQWQVSFDYHVYYERCQPKQCTYIYNSKDSLIYIITTLLGLIGGLVNMLKILVPFLVKHLYQLADRNRWRRQQTVTTRHGSGYDQPSASLSQTIRKLLHIVKTFNYYSLRALPIDRINLRNQILATKCFFSMTIISTIIVFTYLSVAMRTEVIKISTPSVEQYLNLHSKYGETLSCGCSKVSIECSQFSRIQYSQHEICSSFFISRTFRDILFPANVTSYQYWDFQGYGQYFFQAMEIFCLMTNRSIVEAIDMFNVHQYVTATVATVQLFHSQTNFILDQYINSVIKELLNAVTTLHDISFSNALFSGRFTNYFFQLYNVNPIFGIRFTIPVSLVYLGCDCALSSKCSQSAFIRFGPRTTDVFTIPGFQIGCSTTEPVLKSTLECLYNTTCISLLLFYMNVDSSFNIIASTLGRTSRYSTQTTIEELVNNLMIEQLNFSASFENYYKECNPIECTYTEVIKNSFTFIITTMFSLIGGLVTILSFVALQMITQGHYLVKKFKRRTIIVAPEVST